MSIKINEVLKLNIRVFKVIKKYDRFRTRMTSFYWIMDTLETLIYNVLFLPFIYYAVQRSVPPTTYLIIALSMFILLLGAKVFSSFYNTYYIDKSNENVRFNFQKSIFAKVKVYDISHLNKTENLDRINMFLKFGHQKMMEALDIIWWGISTIVLLLTYFIVIGTLDPFFIIIAIIGALLTYKISNILGKEEYAQSVEEITIQRRLDYVHRVFSLPIFADDIRTSKISSVIKKIFVDAIGNLRKIMRKFTRKIIVLRCSKNTILFLIATTITSLYLGYQYIIKNSIDLTVGEIMVIQTNVFQIAYVLTNVSTLIPQLKKNAMYLKDYYEFMDYEPEIKENEEGIIAKCGANSLDIKNVSFSYDGSNMVLKNINLSIKAGEKIAIVGHNGAGKSTLIKLLLRLYLPQNGQIELDHIPASEYKLNSYRDRFGVAFQNSVIYAANVAENVMMRPVNLAEDAEIVSQSLKKSGIYECIERCSSGIASIMTKEFDEEGLELSGGQIQKIALARVFAKDSGIIILDEPSSALDPISEHEMYRNMLGLSSGRTFIVISHRLSITKDVDRIVLLENGEIVECGSHNELIAKNGKYAKMWNVQAKQFS